MVKKLFQKQDYSPEIEGCNAIIRGAKNLQGLSLIKQWKEVVQHINQKIEKQNKKLHNLLGAELCEVNKYIPTDRELAEAKALVREINALEEIRDIEKSYSKVLEEALKKKRNLEELVKKQEEKPKERKYSY